MIFQKRVLLLVLGLGLYALLAQFAWAHGMSEAEKQSIIDGGSMAYLWLGATHMLTGYDHLAFVFGIIFFLTTFRDIAKYVTAFTLGHSVTLIYATFNGVQLDYFLIDAIIGLSVCYIAFANIDGFRKYLNIKPPNMLLMIVGLGLIHGFGLSTRLQQLPLQQDNLLLEIIAFNVGVELGQISALAVMLLAIAGWRRMRSFQSFSLVTNYTLILVGAYLFLMQMHGYSHVSNPDEFVAAKPAPVGTEVARAASNTAVLTAPIQSWKDEIEIKVPARGDLEYKLYMAAGGELVYQWQTDGGELFYDFHGEPAGDTTGYFMSFEKGTRPQATGTLAAIFDGTHGWYWKNTSNRAVSIRLRTRGGYQTLDERKPDATAASDSPRQPDTRETIF